MKLGPDAAARPPADLAMDRYADGDEAAFGALYDALAPALWRFALHLTRRSVAAEDLVQQTFLQLHRARDRWVPGARLVPWAFAITRHAFIDSTRRRSGQPSAEGPPEELDLPADVAPADETLARRQQLGALLRRIELLPGNQGIAFQLVVLDELSIAEAAEVLGFTTGNVKVLVHRAREALRRAAETDA